MIRTVDAQYETIALELRDGVLIVTLNRPESLNAFTITMLMSSSTSSGPSMTTTTSTPWW